MTRLSSIAALGAVLALTGCVTGKAEYEAADGMLSPSRLDRARATCQMRLRDREELQIATGQFPDVHGNVDDLGDCMRAQGIQLKGFRQDNGQLTKYPYKGGGVIEKGKT